MNNLGGTTPWALALSTVLLATSVEAQEFGRAPEGKKKAESPSIASVDESQFGCLDGNGVTCCLPSGECIEVDDPDDQELPGDAKLICRDLGGEAISYLTDFADDPTSFESCAVVDAWGGCSRIPCCLPNGSTVTITTAQCRGVGGELAQVFDGTCLASDWMRGFTIGECFVPQGGQCIAGGPYNEIECEDLGGVFLGFPTYGQVAGRPEWFAPVSTGASIPNEGLYPGRQGAEFRHTDLEIAQDLQQKGLELGIRPVNLIDQKNNRFGAENGLEQGPLQQKAHREEHIFLGGDPVRRLGQAGGGRDGRPPPPP